MQKLCTLRNVRSFLGVFPSDLLPQSDTQSGTVIINGDPHTEKGSHWLTVHVRPKSASAYNFVSYGIVQLVPDIQVFIRRDSTVSNYNRRQPQCLTNNVCGKYCCLFALYTYLGYTAQQFVGLFDNEGTTDKPRGSSHPSSDRYCQVTAAAVVNAALVFIKRK